MVDRAALQTDEAKWRELYVQAEEILVKTDAAIAPLWWSATLIMTKPYVQRTHTLLGGLDHYEKWDINK